MGKGTDKLYITHSEWSSADNFSASAGAGVSDSRNAGTTQASFKRLPFNFCALSLQPFEHPVCTSTGTIFELTHILPWLKKHKNTNPVDGTPQKSSDLIKLNFHKNDDGEYVDPVTFKPFTDNSHIVAIKKSGNVFAADTVERLNAKAKHWRDLVDDMEFSRADVITLQDPQHLEARNLSSFQYIKNGEKGTTEKKDDDPAKNLNLKAIGSSAKVLRAKEAVAKARQERAQTKDPNHTSVIAKQSTTSPTTVNHRPTTLSKALHTGSSTALPYNAAQHTTGKAAASLTSTFLDPHTTTERATLTEEEYLLKPRRVKQKGYANLRTTQGTLTLELIPEYAPKAVWNFINLAKRGYYNNIPFHRNIKNFMIQGGYPTGTGRGGTSLWEKPFEDEWAQSPLKHDKRGILSMANKGRNTNTSQFFVTYRAVSHLDRKHTILGRVVLDDKESAESEATLKRLGDVETDARDKPVSKCNLEEVVILVDPFEEFRNSNGPHGGAKGVNGDKSRRVSSPDRNEDDDTTTWTGKKIRSNQNGAGGAKDEAVGVGKYLDEAMSAQKRGVAEVDAQDEVIEEWETPFDVELPPAKKKKAVGRFGNFDSW